MYPPRKPEAPVTSTFIACTLQVGMRSVGKPAGRLPGRAPGRRPLARPDVAGAGREVGEVHVRRGRRRPGGVVAPEEGGKEDAVDLQRAGRAERQALLVQDRFLVEPDADPAVAPARRVEADLLLEQVPATRDEMPPAAAQGGAVVHAGGQ